MMGNARIWHSNMTNKTSLLLKYLMFHPRHGVITPKTQKRRDRELGPAYNHDDTKLELSWDWQPISSPSSHGLGFHQEAKICVYG